jgi:hypothetical protein
MGRSSQLTPELRADVERELADGVPVAVVAQRFGIGRRTLTPWIADCRVVRRRLNPTPQLPPTPVGPSFVDQFDRAEPSLVAVGRPGRPSRKLAGRGLAGRPGPGLLERRWPQRWARQPQRQIDEVMPGPAAARREPLSMPSNDLRGTRSGCRGNP